KMSAPDPDRCGRGGAAGRVNVKESRSAEIGMQTEAEAFLARIRAFPDDDAPRLVFADWLDEQNDPRGAFIRVQIALAQLAEEETAAGDADGLARVDREAR